MNLESELFELFGEDNLIPVSIDKLNKIDIHLELKELILRVGFPYTFSDIRLSMEFSPISLDRYISGYLNQSRNLLIIGCKSHYGYLGFMSPFDDIGLHKGSSLSEIDERLTILGRESQWLADDEIKHSSRICVDLDDGSIVYIKPGENSVNFCNSNLRNLLRSIISYRGLQESRDKGKILR